MNNISKIALGISAMIIVSVGAVWWDAAPQPADTTFPDGSLGQAVATACDPIRQGSFAGDGLKDALACRDLDAQQSMASSTARLVWISWLQIFVGIGGGIAVIWTVLVALRSMKVTQRALEHQQTAARLQLRPVIQSMPVTVTLNGADRLRIAFHFKNVGGSTARNVKRGFTWKVLPIANGISQLDESRARLKTEVSDLTRDGTTGFAVRPGVASTAGILAGTHCMQLAYCAVYDDDFGGKYKFTVCREYWSRDLSEYRNLSGFSFDEPALKDREN